MSICFKFWFMLVFIWRIFCPEEQSSISLGNRRKRQRVVMTGDETRGCQEDRSFVLARNTPHPDRVTSKGQDGTSFFSLFIMLLIQTVIVMDALSSSFITCLMTIYESPSTVCCSSQNKYHVTAFSNWLHQLSILGGSADLGLMFSRWVEAPKKDTYLSALTGSILGRCRPWTQVLSFCFYLQHIQKTFHQGNMFPGYFWK